MRLLLSGTVALLLLLAGASANRAAADPVRLTRLDAAQAFYAIAQIGQYKCPGSAAAQQPVMDCFLKVSVPTRSTLGQDALALRTIVLATQSTAAELTAAANANPKLATEAARQARAAADTAKLSEQPVTVELVRIAEADLDLADNPQITPLLETQLAPILTPPQAASGKK